MAPIHRNECLSPLSIDNPDFPSVTMRISFAAVLCAVGSASAFVISPHREVSSALSVANKSGSKGTGEGWIDPSSPVNSEASLKKTLEKSLEGSNFCKKLSILGSTGSIGTQTLQIVDACPDNFEVESLSAGGNSELMAEQVLKYKPKIATMSTPEAAADLKARLEAAGCEKMPEIMYGDDGIVAAACVDTADTVVTGIVGAAGLKPTIEAIKLKKDIALANKETLISGGPVINPLVEEYGVNMVRINTEKSTKDQTEFCLATLRRRSHQFYNFVSLNSCSFLLIVNTRRSFSVCRVSLRAVSVVLS